MAGAAARAHRIEIVTSPPKEAMQVQKMVMHISFVLSRVITVSLGES